MHPDIRLETHHGCGGIAVSVPSGSVNGGRVLMCLKCQEDANTRLRLQLEAVQHLAGEWAKDHLDKSAEYPIATATMSEKDRAVALVHASVASKFAALHTYSEPLVPLATRTVKAAS